MVSTHSTKLHDRLGVQSQASAAVVTMDTDMERPISSQAHTQQC